MLKEKGKSDGVKDRTDGLVAAMKIQKVWRGFATRRKTRRRKMEEMYLIGMVPRPKDKNAVAEEEEARTTTRQHRYQQQTEFREDFEKSLVATKELISKKQGVAIAEQIADEVRDCFKDVHLQTGKLPDFPSEENGGSRNLMSRQGWYEPHVFLLIIFVFFCNLSF